MQAERLILGTAGLGGAWGKVDPEESFGTILYALEYGIGAIDTAPAYGDAEVLVGEALRHWNGRRPQVSSKVGRLQAYAADNGRYNFTDDGMRRSAESSLKVLGGAGLDILFLHDPEAAPWKEADRIVGTMIRLREEGYARRIGLGGNAPGWMHRYAGQGIFDVYMEFNRLNACNVTALADTLPFCKSFDIPYFAASPLNMGLLGRNFSAFSMNRPAWLDSLPVMVARELDSIADRYSLDLSELAHRFLLSLPGDFHIVLGASNRLELHSSIGSLEKGPLPKEMLKEIMQYSIANMKQLG
ncbi:aldo/keto reductase [Flavitalea flava]